MKLIRWARFMVADAWISLLVILGKDSEAAWHKYMSVARKARQ